jgi:subtilisin family serine protease
VPLVANANMRIRTVVFIAAVLLGGAGATSYLITSIKPTKPLELRAEPGAIDARDAARGVAANGSAVRGPVALGLARRSGAVAGSAAGPYREGHVLVGFRPGVSALRERQLERRAGAVEARRLGVAVLLRVPRGGVPGVIGRLRRDPAVRYAEPDYVVGSSAMPNDPEFGLQWGLQNTGQVVNRIAGTAGADEQAVPAWSVTTGSASVVIGETDTGVEYTHRDLAANIWSNPGGVLNCPAGTRGFDVVPGEAPCDPMDQDTKYGGHGTHVAGIMGAAGNNGVGVTGINWHTSIMPFKVLDSNSIGSTSNVIAALQLVVKAKQAGQNIRVVNDSTTYVGTGYSQALSDEIDQLGANDILFVVPAGNSGENNDDPANARYPCDYSRPNEICVAASDNQDRLPSWANYGPNKVDLAAPGDTIYSTLRNASYGYVSGSSMSAAEVSGAAALILSVGYQSATALKADILNHVDPIPGLAGRVRTGGRLDICKALPGCTRIQTVPAPTVASPPVISGTASQGETLTASHGSWTNGPTSYVDVWEDCDSAGGSCSAIPGAMSQTYVVAAGDVGHTLRVQEVANNADGSSAPSASAPTAVVQGQGDVLQTVPALRGGGAGTLAISHAGVKGATMSMSLRCSGARGASCTVSMTLTITETVGGEKAMLATTTTTLTAGQSKLIRVTLSKTGKRLLSRRHRLMVKLVISASGKTISVQTIIFRTRRKRARSAGHRGDRSRSALSPRVAGLEVERGQHGVRRGRLVERRDSQELLRGSEERVVVKQRCRLRAGSGARADNDRRDVAPHIGGVGRAVVGRPSLALVPG